VWPRSSSRPATVIPLWERLFGALTASDSAR
jgi:hypothetical protein